MYSRHNRQRLWPKAATMLSLIFLLSSVALRAVMGAPMKLPKHRPSPSHEVVIPPSSPIAVKWLQSLEEAKRKRKEKRIAYLTFDDGPDRTVTPAVVKILDQEGVNGTFFVIGYKVKRDPDIVRLSYEKGNAIGNHTYDHVYTRIYASPMAYLSSLNRCNAEIKKATGRYSLITRPPGGAFHWIRQAGNYSVLNKAGFRIYTWNVDCGDGTGRPSSFQMIRTVVGQTQRWGSHRVIVLFHDTDKNVPRALVSIIRQLKAMGFTFKPLDTDVEEMK